MAAVNEIAKECISCNLCVAECAFLQQYGSPGTICRAFQAGGETSATPVFACNLCGLCRVVCPKNLDCAAAFLDIRRTLQRERPAAAKQTSVQKRHNPLCRYEARASSPLFSLYLFPEGCDAVFFPGCTLAATRSGLTRTVYDQVRKIDPTIGIVLDCCTRPSHDLGLQAHFEEKLSQLLRHLTDNNVKKIFTACPSCHTTFEAYAPGFAISSIYEWLAGNLPRGKSFCDRTMTVHDSCTARSLPQIHDAVRTLIAGMGARIEEMPHNRETAICCGEGAAAAFIAPQITAGWRKMRKSETSGKRVVTYCAGCSNTLGRQVPTTHLLDLLFDPENARRDKEKIARAPFTYVNRLLLKNRLKKSAATARVTSRSSTPAGSKLPASRRFVKIAIVALLLVSFGLQLFGGYPTKNFATGLCLLLFLLVLPIFYAKFFKKGR